ncbi:MAG: transglutaminase-like domain-containing protein [Patescibacteria group bacterium]
MRYHVHESNLIEFVKTLWTKEEIKILRSLSTPAKIQDFVNTLRFRIVGKNETCHSPRIVLRNREAQCVEGAVFAAAALRFHGYKPLILDLVAANTDADHVIAIFKIDGAWGAISKTNHGVLRYREPIYKTVRELAMSYFHEYFLQSNRKKTLRSFSRPVDLSRFDAKYWETNEEPVWFIPEHLVSIAHTPILSRSQIARLRVADPIEATMADFTEWK